MSDDERNLALIAAMVIAVVELIFLVLGAAGMLCGIPTHRACPTEAKVRAFMAGYAPDAPSADLAA